MILKEPHQRYEWYKGLGMRKPQAGLLRRHATLVANLSIKIVDH
jgi:hypothetical protein